MNLKAMHCKTQWTAFITFYKQNNYKNLRKSEDQVSESVVFKFTQKFSKHKRVYCVNPISLHRIYIPNGCKHFKVLLQIFYGNEVNSNKPLKNEKNLWNCEISSTFS